MGSFCTENVGWDLCIIYIIVKTYIIFQVFLWYIRFKSLLVRPTFCIMWPLKRDEECRTFWLFFLTIFRIMYTPSRVTRI